MSWLKTNGMLAEKIVRPKCRRGIRKRKKNHSHIHTNYNKNSSIIEPICTQHLQSPSIRIGQKWHRNNVRQTVHCIASAGVQRFATENGVYVDINKGIPLDLHWIDNCLKIVSLYYISVCARISFAVSFVSARRHRFRCSLRSVCVCVFFSHCLSS